VKVLGVTAVVNGTSSCIKLARPEVFINYLQQSCLSSTVYQIRMRSLTIAALAGLGSVVSSQSIDLAYVNAQPDPTYTIVHDQRAQTVTYNQDSAIASVVAVALQTPIPDPGEGALHSRNVFGKRAGPCEDLQNNANTYNAKLDPAEAFLADDNLQKQARDAKVPAGYTQVYSNLQKSASANGYMG
jgi:hypothetical protein